MEHSVPVSIQVSVPQAEAPPFGCKYTNLTANGSTILKKGPGRLHAVTINIAGSSSNRATVFDNVAPQGKRIATISTTTTPGQVFLYDVAFEVGLTIAVMYGVAGDITVSWA